MIRLIAPALVALAVTGMTVAVPLEPVEAKRFPKRVKTPKKTPEFRQVKAQLSTFRATGARAYNNFKGAYRSERRNRQLLEMAQANLNSARNAFRADGTPQNQARLVMAQSSFQEIDAQYRNALAVYRGAKAEVRRLQDIRATNLNVQRQQQGVQPRPPQAGRPRFAQGARVQQVRVGATVMQNPYDVLRGGGQATRFGAYADPRAFMARNAQNNYISLAELNALNTEFGGQSGNAALAPGSPLYGPPPRMFGQDLYVDMPGARSGPIAQAAAPGANQSPTAYISLAAIGAGSDF
ncbi:hypothetical protein [Erythrobacter sp. HL-111]|uniref:hypothetical protein n=1 Tax=Erythrobacter sp. HL-111 TaxID=1798193 RepID=UPI0006DA41B5|nr:hypothetical protein [Erythrobacter sp. HL-111]KPP96196.1 MAG: hypothetical protein HLUCCO15_01010 [Erythrobacteraceae bacterium HL-111]SDR78465.1 hypothetical protein SAMN04515621_0356 [Erythrobacter sp. HL-111]